MSIEKRKNYLNQLAQRFDCEKITDLMLEVKIPNNLFQNISIAAKTYVSKCIDPTSIVLDEKELINQRNINMRNNTRGIPHKNYWIKTNYIVPEDWYVNDV